MDKLISNQENNGAISKVLFAPHEIAGQMSLLSSTMRKRGISAKCVSYARGNYLSTSCDLSLDFTKKTRRITKAWRSTRFAVSAIREFDVFNFFYGRSLTPGMFDLPLIKYLKKPIVMHFRGAEILNGDYYEYQRMVLSGEVARRPPLQRNHQVRCLRTWRRWANRLLVSEPDLLRIVPEATLVQQAIDCREWHNDNSSACVEDTVRITHAPTARWRKGTEYVVAAIEELRKRGYNVSLELVEGVPQSEVKQIFSRADIGIDQVLLGWYGNVSIQFMALGKPVICYIDPELAHYLPDLPIVSATPTTIAEQLESLVCDAQRRRQLGKAGRQYVERWHDAERIVDQLIEIYQDVLN